MDTIHAWFKKKPLATDAALRTTGNPQGPVFWLDGVAGTGKSTIAQTVGVPLPQYETTWRIILLF